MRELGDVLRVRRLGWFGHVVRREETEILGKTQHVVVPGGGHLEDLEKKYARRTCRKSRRKIEISGSVSSTVSPHENELTRH